MKYFVFAFVLLLGCTDREAMERAREDQRFGEVKQTMLGLLCPEGGIGSQKGEIPIKKVKLGEHTLIVCGWRDRKNSEQVRFSEFDIYAFNKEKKHRKVYTGSALDWYAMKEVDGALRLYELQFYGERPVPILFSDITCGAEGCSNGKSQCVKVVEKSDKKSESLAKILNSIGKPQKDKNGRYLPVDTWISEVLADATRGSSEAIAFFKKKPEGLITDGAVSENYTDGARFVKRLEALECVKKSAPES